MGKQTCPGLNSILAYVSDAEHIASNAYSSRGAIHPPWQEIESFLPLSCLRGKNVWSKAKSVKCKWKSPHHGNTFLILSSSIAGIQLGYANVPNRWHVVAAYTEEAQEQDMTHKGQCTTGCALLPWIWGQGISTQSLCCWRWYRLHLSNKWRRIHVLWGSFYLAKPL